MRLSAHNLGEGNTKTAFQNFMETYDLLLLTVKVQCPNCGHVWGIKVDDYEFSTDIPEKKFQCQDCGHYQAGGQNPNELKLSNGTVRELNGYMADFAVPKEA